MTKSPMAWAYKKLITLQNKNSIPTILGSILIKMKMQPDEQIPHMAQEYEYNKTIILHNKNVILTILGYEAPQILQEKQSNKSAAPVIAGARKKKKKTRNPNILGRPIVCYRLPGT